MKKFTLFLLVALLIVATCFTGCGESQQEPEKKTEANTEQKEEPAKKDTAPEEEGKKTEEIKPLKIGVSNGVIGNNWRTQMIDSMEMVAEEYKEKGWVEELIVQNAGADVNNQIAQIRNMLNSDIDLLLINPNSTTALNPVIEEAANKGVKVISFDQAVTSEHAFNVCVKHYDWIQVLAEWLFDDQLNGQGDVVVVSGVAGNPANTEIVKGIMDTAAKYPDINILTEVNGNWDQANAQQVMSNVIASYPNIDGVISKDSMALGVLNAFVAAKRDIPALTGETMVGYLKMWKKLKDEQGFESIGQVNPPGIGTSALKMGVRMLQGRELIDSVASNIENNTYYYEVQTVVTNDNLDEYYEKHKDKPDSYFPDEWFSEEDVDKIFK